jgi:hypothetical protein
MRKHTLLLLTIFFFFLELWFASQVYLPLSSEVSEDNDAFSFKAEHDFTLYKMNVLEPSFNAANQLLTISSERGGDDFAWSIFQAYIDVNVPFRRDLKLRYAMFTPQLNFATDAVRFRFFLVNNTHFVVLAYEIGFTEEDHVPDPDAKSYSYVFYQIGNDTNMWFRGERSLWNDLINKGLLLENSWKIARITFGVMSYRKDPDMDNQRMEGVLKLDDNSLYYENLLNVKMTSYGSQVSHYAIAGMVMSIVLFFTCSCIIIKMGNSKNFRSAYLARLSLYNLVDLQLYLRIHIPHFKRNKYQIFKSSRGDKIASA